MDKNSFAYSAWKASSSRVYWKNHPRSIRM